MLTSSRLINGNNGVANGAKKGCSLENDNSTFVHNDHSTKEMKKPTYPKNVAKTFEDFKKEVTNVVDEYFINDNISFTSTDLVDLDMPNYHHYFVKKLVSMAMDRRENEKEMAAVLLSSLYLRVINPQQVYHGFCNLVESADDLIVDIPHLVEVLSIFIARAVIDGILPLEFLSKQMSSLPKDSKGEDILTRAKKGYLTTPCLVISKRKTVENTRETINTLLKDYLGKGDKKEAFKSIKDLNVPFFHHEIVKKSIIMAMENQKYEGQILDLLKMTEDEGLINSSQMSKGFGRLIDNIDELSLEIPNGREILQSLISKASSEGWLHASSLKSIPKETNIKTLKKKALCIAQEYFMSGDVSDVSKSLETEGLTEFNSVFVTRLLSLAMDRKKREKEMASVLLSSLCLPFDDVISGFVTLIDEALAPSNLDEIQRYCIGNRVVPATKSLLNARLAAERVLRCWGGGGDGDGSIGSAIDDVKDKIGRLLEEYESGGGFKEAYRCIKELGMPFLHHEIVKKVLVAEIDKRDGRMWGFLDECFKSGLITVNQIMKGFGRVYESLDDLVLDVPDARRKFVDFVEKGKVAGWLDPTFCSSKSRHTIENGL